MATLSIEQYSEKQTRAAHRAMEQIERCDARLGTHYKHARHHERRSLRAVVHVCIPTAENPIVSEQHPNAFRAWAYNISQGGVGLISPILLADNLSIGLALPDGRVIWRMGRVVRCKPIPECDAFHDCGVAFGAAEPAQEATTPELANA